MATNTAARVSPRERLLAAANELFYEEGVHTVGIDRVIERAGVAKATLYNSFGSKDELIRAYLAGRHAIRRDHMTRALTRYDNPRDRLLGVFDVLTETFTNPEYRGCAFLNASAEARPDSPIVAATDEYRAWVRSLLTDLAREAGLAEPEHVGRQLALLYDGAGISGWMDRDPNAAVAARGVAEVLIDASVLR
ncbi:MAG TPA: TetR/AcrR family transcriptional regulator [Pseudonocardiaceae bacterium]